VKEWDVASGYEKDACGVDPNRGWGSRRRWTRAQAWIERAILACGLLVYCAVPYGAVRFLLG
jgi:hypothetical protein